jgi:ubiquinone/menaquinone biosynthesis C-methylase UbiE
VKNVDYMKRNVPDRLRWAVTLLNVLPNQHLLEIGCGHGTAVAQICDLLTTGTITAIDQSDKMISVARQKNSAHIASGKARFIKTALHEAEFGDTQFDTIFAVNVNVFWMQPEKELSVVKRILARTGLLYLIFQPPAGQDITRISDSVVQNLHNNGFPSIRTESAELSSGRAVCITGCQLGYETTVTGGKSDHS